MGRPDLGRDDDWVVLSSSRSQGRYRRADQVRKARYQGRWKYRRTEYDSTARSAGPAKRKAGFDRRFKITTNWRFILIGTEAEIPSRFIFLERFLHKLGHGVSSRPSEGSSALRHCGCV